MTRASWYRVGSFALLLLVHVLAWKADDLDDQDAGTLDDLDELAAAHRDDLDALAAREAAGPCVPCRRRVAEGVRNPCRCGRAALVVDDLEAAALVVDDQDNQAKPGEAAAL